MRGMNTKSDSMSHVVGGWWGQQDDDTHIKMSPLWPHSHADLDEEAKILPLKGHTGGD